MSVTDATAADLPAVELAVFVPSAAADMGTRAGSPAAQGSKEYKGHVRSRKTGRMVPNLQEVSAAVAPWRTLIAAHVAPRWRPRPPMAAALGLRLEYVMPRPIGTSKRHTPPAIKRPDLDKLQRAVFDSLTGIVWRDDSIIIDVHATKRLAEVGEQPGCWIRVWRA